MRPSTLVHSVTLAMAVVAAPAQAGLVVYDFSVASATGPLAGQPFGGHFTYDSSIVPVSGNGIVTTGPGGSALRSFQLELGDTRFTAGNVAATLTFQNGELSRFRIGETAPGASVDGTDYFFMDSLFGWGEFRLAGNRQLYGGMLSAQQVNPQVDRYLLNVPLLTGALAGQTAKGSFAINHALAQPNTLQVDPVDTRGNLNSLLDFQFTLNGIDYTTANTGIERLGFDASGRVNEFLIGAHRSLDLASFTDDFLMLRGSGGVSQFRYTVLDAASHGSGELSFAPVTAPISTVIGTTTILDAIPPPPGGYTVSIQNLASPAPEPSTFAMLALGMAALFSRRRAAARRRD